MTIAIQSGTHTEVVWVDGRRYHWQEGPMAVDGRAFVGRGAQARGAFYRAYLPTLERRGVTPRVLRAGRRGVLARAWWVWWSRPGQEAVWSLWVSARRSGVPAQVLGAGDPANDGAVLACWGDGPVLAWCSRVRALREVTREALRALPTFLARGLVSADEALALRVEPYPEHG